MQEEASAASIADLLGERTKVELAGIASLLAPLCQPPLSIGGGTPMWWPQAVRFTSRASELKVQEAREVIPCMLANIVRTYGEKRLSSSG